MRAKHYNEQKQEGDEGVYDIYTQCGFPGADRLLARF